MLISECKNGVKVTLSKPADLEKSPGWVSGSMDNLIGKILTISGVSNGLYVEIRECAEGWNYSSDWLTIAETENVKGCQQCCGGWGKHKLMCPTNRRLEELRGA